MRGTHKGILAQMLEDLVCVVLPLDEAKAVHHASGFLMSGRNLTLDRRQGKFDYEAARRGLKTLTEAIRATQKRSAPVRPKASTREAGHTTKRINSKPKKRSNTNGTRRTRSGRDRQSGRAR